MSKEKFTEKIPKQEQKERKEKEPMLKILVIEDNPEYIKDFEQLEEKIKNSNLPIIFEKVSNMKEFYEKKKEGYTGALVDIFIPEDERNLPNLEFEKTFKWKIRITSYIWRDDYIKEFRENHPVELLYKAATEEEKRKEILQELKEFFSLISDLKVGEKTVKEELEEISEEDDFFELKLIKKYHEILNQIPELDIQDEIDRQLLKNTPGIKILEELQKEGIPSTIVTSFGHHGMRIRHVLDYANLNKIPLVETYGGDEESKKDWHKGLVLLLEKIKDKSEKDKKIQKEEKNILTQLIEKIKYLKEKES